MVLPMPEKTCASDGRLRLTSWMTSLGSSALSRSINDGCRCERRRSSITRVLTFGNAATRAHKSRRASARMNNEARNHDADWSAMSTRAAFKVCHRQSQLLEVSSPNREPTITT